MCPKLEGLYHEHQWAFVADISTCHGRKSTGVINNTDYCCIQLRVLGPCYCARWLTGTVRDPVIVISSTCAVPAMTSNKI